MKRNSIDRHVLYVLTNTGGQFGQFPSELDPGRDEAHQNQGSEGDRV